MAISKEEKIQLLKKRMEKVKQLAEKTKKAISAIEKKEADKNRKERARKLIEIAAFYFGNSYIEAYRLLKENENRAKQIKNRLTEDLLK